MCLDVMTFLACFLCWNIFRRCDGIVYTCFQGHAVSVLCRDMVTLDTVHSIGQPCGFTKLFDVNLTEVDTRTRWFVILGVGEENRLNTSPLLCWSVPSSS